MSWDFRDGDCSIKQQNWSNWSNILLLPEIQFQSWNSEGNCSREKEGAISTTYPPQSSTVPMKEPNQVSGRARKGTEPMLWYPGIAWLEFCEPVAAHSTRCSALSLVCTGRCFCQGSESSSGHGVVLWGVSVAVGWERTSSKCKALCCCPSVSVKDLSVLWQWLCWSELGLSWHEECELTRIVLTPVEVLFWLVLGGGRGGGGCHCIRAGSPVRGLRSGIWTVSNLLC